MDRRVIKIGELVLPKGQVKGSEYLNYCRKFDYENMTPLLIDEDNIIIDGVLNYLECVRRGIDVVPVVYKNRTKKISLNQGYNFKIVA